MSGAGPARDYVFAGSVQQVRPGGVLLVSFGGTPPVHITATALMTLGELQNLLTLREYLRAHPELQVPAALFA